MIQKQNIYLHLTVILLMLSCGTAEVLCANDPSSPETLLLKDFRPRSIYNIPQTTVEKAGYPAIDMHAHPYADISARYAETAAIPRFAATFYDKYQDRLVYGTDMTFGTKMYRFTFRILESADEHFYAWDRSSYHWPLYGLGLDEKILRKVYRDNALKMTGK